MVDWGSTRLLRDPVEGDGMMVDLRASHSGVCLVNRLRETG